MLRTMAIQHSARTLENVPAREFDPAVAGLIERNPQTVLDTESLSVATDVGSPGTELEFAL